MGNSLHYVPYYLHVATIHVVRCGDLLLYIQISVTVVVTHMRYIYSVTCYGDVVPHHIQRYTVVVTVTHRDTCSAVTISGHLRYVGAILLHCCPLIDPVFDVTVVVDCCD